MSREKFKKLTAVHSADTIILLRQHFKKLSGDLGEYEEGWSDEKIAIETGAGAEWKGSVMNLRVTNFGKLNHVNNKHLKELNDANFQIEKLKSDVQALLQWATDPKIQKVPLVVSDE